MCCSLVDMRSTLQRVTLTGLVALTTACASTPAPPTLRHVPTRTVVDTVYLTQTTTDTVHVERTDTLYVGRVRIPQRTRALNVNRHVDSLYHVQIADSLALLRNIPEHMLVYLQEGRIYTFPHAHHICYEEPKKHCVLLEQIKR